MKGGLLCAMLALSCTLATAQQVAPGGPTFALVVEAPDGVRQVLERHLELERFHALTDLSDSELSRLLLEAPQNAKDLLATMGFFSPQIQLDLQPAGASTSQATVRLQVDPGPPTRISAVDITLAGPASALAEALLRRQEIADQWSLVVGMPFTQTAWESAKQRALRALTANRFPAGRIASSAVDIQPDTRTARIALVLDPGSSFRLGAMTVSGTRHFDPALVVRLARLSGGDVYDQTQLVEAQRRMVDSGYFDTAQVALDVTGDPQAAPVRIQVVEAPLQKWVLGVGASTDSGARLSVTHTHHQVPGLGWRAVSKLSLDRDTRSIGSELTAQPDDDNWQWATSGLLQTQKIGSFDVTSQRLRAGRSQGGIQVDQNFYLQYDRAQSAAVDLAEPLVVQSLSFNYAYTLRHFDSVPFPSRGWGLGLELGGGSTLGVAQDPYARVLARGQAYLPLGEHADSVAQALRAGRLVLRAQFGAVLAREDAGIPSTQLFLTGGDTSVRGYNRGEIGLDLPGTQTTAGRYLAAGSAEWQRPIMDGGLATDWESAVFIDAGGVANTPHELQARIGVGAGIRWKSPVGPLQIDLAYGVPQGHLHLHMNVGFTF